MSASTPAASSPVDADVLITREFDAPRELVFKAWTDPDLLARWYAPRGCEIVFHRLEIRPGGRYHACIRNPQYGDCFTIGEYREVVSPERLVLTMVMADQHGDAIDPAVVLKDPAWPKETTLTVSFDDLGGRTRVTLHQTVSEALAKKTGAHPSWLQMLDRLAEQLAGA